MILLLFLPVVVTCCNSSISRRWLLHIRELFEFVEHGFYHGLLLIQLACHDFNIAFLGFECIFRLLMVRVQALHLHVELLHHLQLPLLFPQQLIESSFPEFFGI